MSSTAFHGTYCGSGEGLSTEVPHSNQILLVPRIGTIIIYLFSSWYNNHNFTVDKNNNVPKPLWALGEEEELKQKSS